MIQRLIVAALAIALTSCASTSGDDDWEPLVSGPKTPLCDQATYPTYASGRRMPLPLLCNSGMVNLLVAGPGERAYRALWAGGGEMDGFGSLEVLVRADGTGWAGPARAERRPLPRGAFLVDSIGPTQRVELTADQVAAFERAFAATGFARAPLMTQQGLYSCIHGDEMMAETLIDGAWRGIVRENCGDDGVLARGVWNLMVRTASTD